MIPFFPLKRRILTTWICIFSFSMFASKVTAQNFYTDSHTFVLANYYYQKQQYDLALQFVNQIDSSTNSSILLKMKCLRGLMRYPQAIDCFGNFLAKTLDDTLLLKELSINQFLAGDTFNVVSFKDIRALKMLYETMHTHTFDKMHELITQYKKSNVDDIAISGEMATDFKEWLIEIAKYKKRKKGLAVIYSLFPGGGKWYLNRIPDALTSFSLITINGSLSWYAFERRGSRTFWGYFFAGLASAYYLSSFYSNAYLTTKDASVYHDKLKNEASILAHHYFLEFP